MKEIILNNIETIVSNFLYYDRKDDEELPMGEIEKAIQNGVITVDEIVATFKAELEKELSE